MILGIDTSIDARTQLTLMGCNFVWFASGNHLFETLFIKFPYNYMELSQEELSPVNSALPGFEHFKSVALRLKDEGKSF